MNLIFNEILRADIPGVDHATRQKLKRAKKAFHQHIPALVKNIKAQKPKQTLAALEKLVAGVSEQSVPLHKPAQKIAQLKNLKYQGDNIYYVLDELKNFISDWGYDELLMKKFAFLRKVRVPQAEGPDDLIYYNHKDTSRTKIVRKKDLHIPQIGESSLVPVEAQDDLNFWLEDKGTYENLVKIHNWYEKTLQHELKKCDLKIARVPITTRKGGRRKVAHAWKIVAGLEEFKTRPTEIFSTRPALKMDCETMPRLARAAEKFGGPPRQLQVINDYLVSAAGPPRTGGYNRSTDEIKLASRSLAILAHESLHRLKAKGLIPPQEYSALVAAGKRLARNNPQEQDYLNQRNSTGQLLYPPGPAREEEQAALFVETYYENNARARKNLMGLRLTMTEKVLDYVHEVVDTLGVRFRHQPSMARNFLRRIERNYLNPEKNRPGPKKKVRNQRTTEPGQRFFPAAGWVPRASLQDNAR